MTQEEENDKEIISTMMQEILTAISIAVKEITGNDLGIMFMAYNKDPTDPMKGVASYISNCQQSEVEEEMQNLLRRWEAVVEKIT